MGRISPEMKNAMRVMPIDFPDEWSELDYLSSLDEMDQFAQEERRWNPFFVEFYRVPDAHIGYLMGTDWLTRGMVLSLPMIIAGGVLLVLARRGANNAAVS